MVIVNKMENLKEKIQKFESLEEKIRTYLYPKLYKLLLDGKINNGKYNTNRTPEEIISIRDFSVNKDNISVGVELWWSGDVYDSDSISMTQEEWNLI